MEGSAYERARYAIHLVITAASIALTEPVPVPWIGERRDRKGAEHGRGQNQLFQFRLVILSHFRPDKIYTELNPRCPPRRITLAVDFSL
jgi:hypothetical protein